MVHFTKTLFLSLFLFSLLSIQTHCRESQFFSKFNRNNPQETTSTLNPLDQSPSFVPEATHETTFPNKEEKLYGDESFNNNNYDEKVSSYEPYTTPSLTQTQESYNYEKYPNNKESYYNNENNENYYSNKNGYEKNQERGSFAGNRLKGRRYNADDLANNNYYNNVERQGMSDTRFVENGKYFYDVNDEKNNNNYYTNRYKNYQTGAFRNFDGHRNNGVKYYGNSNDGYENEQEDQFRP